MLNDLGCAYARLKKYKEARTFVAAGDNNEPRFCRWFLNLGMVNLSLHDREATLRQYVVLKTLDRGMAEKLYAMLYGEKILQVSAIKPPQRQPQGKLNSAHPLHLWEGWRGGAELRPRERLRSDVRDL